MMNCPKCGKQVNNRNRFCENCGALIIQQKKPPVSYDNKRKSHKTPIIILSAIIAILVIVIIMVVLLFIFPKGTNNLAIKNEEPVETSTLEIIPTVTETSTPAANNNETVSPTIPPTITEKYSIGLKDLTVIIGQVKIETEICTDLLGNEYPPNNLCSVNKGWGADGQAVIYLNNKYKTITGEIIKGKADPFGGNIDEIYIYGTNDESLENKTLLYSKKFYDTTEPDNIEIDISDYKYLSIENDGYFYLNNFTFS